jgi:hypothetical protein
MTDERRLSDLMAEMERVGVDPESFPAGFAVRDEDALQALRALDDGAGFHAFLARVRENLASDAPAVQVNRATGASEARS